MLLDPKFGLHVVLTTRSVCKRAYNVSLLRFIVMRVVSFTSGRED